MNSINPRKKLIKWKVLNFFKLKSNLTNSVDYNDIIICTLLELENYYSINRCTSDEVVFRIEWGFFHSWRGDSTWCHQYNCIFVLRQFRYTLNSFIICQYLNFDSLLRCRRIRFWKHLTEFLLWSIGSVSSNTCRYCSWMSLITALPNVMTVVLNCILNLNTNRRKRYTLCYTHITDNFWKTSWICTYERDNTWIISNGNLNNSIQTKINGSFHKNCSHFRLPNAIL